MRSRGLLVAFVMLVGAVGCAASLDHPPDAPPAGWSPTTDAGAGDDAPAAGEPEMVTCPPLVGCVTAIKNMTF